MKKETIAVSEMSCAHCEARVNSALEALPGVAQSKASAKKGSVAVKYDESAVTLDQMKAAIREAGYEVA